MTAALSITCPGCEQRLRVPASLAGRAARCPNCRIAMKVGAFVPPLPTAPRMRPRATCADPLRWAALVAGVALACAAVVLGVALLAPREKEAPPPPGVPVALVDTLPIVAKKKEAVSYAEDVKPILDKYCMRCHSTAKKRGGIILDKQADDDAVRKHLALWEKAGDSLRAGEMPPEGAKKPSAAEMATVNKWLDAVVFKLDCTGPRDPGRVTIRRLNRAEYDNTIRDLLGVDFKPAKDFPADDVGYGFDNIGDVLSLPPLLMEKYVAAAEQAVDQAWAKPEIRKKLAPRGRRGGGGGSLADSLKRFASRAWRRPAKDEEVKRLLALAKRSRDQGDPSDVATKLAFQAVLVSPWFLFRIEEDRDTQQLSEHELAARLSYFLWSSMPDDELAKLADKGGLRAGLEAQVRRMLKDPKARALADNFAMQWLNLRPLASFSPDPKRFPAYSARLRKAMLRETSEFFMHVVKEDRPVLDFLAADYSFLNADLARHYGIKGVKGVAFRKVSLAGTPRGGVLTHASVLAVTSNPTRTSPVKRGKWVLDNILGTPPPPPPPDVPELKEGGELKGTLREQMEQHRKDPACATCHAKMDPLGFGYENFDAIGMWRAQDEGKHKIDASGVLPDGSKFDGPAQLRKVLLARKEQFTRCLADKMLTYAIGRGTERADRCSIEETAKAVAESGHKFSELVLQIVKSDPFQKRRAKGSKKR